MRNINNDLNSVCVVGMGYVGLTLATALAEVGYKVTGIEINKKLVKNLNSGKVHFLERGLEPRFKKQLKNGNIKITNNNESKNFDVIVICVATPIDKKTFKPIVDHINNSLKTVSRLIRKGSMVLMRSTLPVGLSRETVIPKIEEFSGLTVGNDFFFAFTPERTLEGKALTELYHNTQIVGGFSSDCNLLASTFFQKLTSTIVNVSSIEAAEMIKMIDNSYRDVSFAYANELALISEHLNLDAHEVINAANTDYPRNNVPLPSPGVGGACLSKDPYILLDSFRSHGLDGNLIKQSRNINEASAEQIYTRCSSALESVGKDIKNSKIFVVGFAFKGEPETSDLRESTTLWFLDELREHGISEIAGYDPVVSPNVIRNLGIQWTSVIDGFKNADVVFIMNNHRSYIQFDIHYLLESMNKPALFYDAWQIFHRNEVMRSPGVLTMSVGRG